MPDAVEIVVNEAEKAADRAQNASDSLERITEALASRALAQIRAEDQGWLPIFGNGDHADEIMDLDELKDFSAQIQKLVVHDGPMKQGSNLRTVYTWGRGIKIENIPEGGTRGRQNVRRLMESPTNQANVFGSTAHEMLERCAFTDGNLFLMGNERTKELRQIPLREITNVLRNPNFSAEVWAYRREWMDYSGDKPETRVRWIYTDRYTGTKRKQKTVNGKTEYFDLEHVLFDQSFNAQIGSIWGVPDGVAAIAWDRIFRNAMVDGTHVQRALAAILFKATAQSKSGVADQALKVSGARGVANTASMTNGQDFQALSTSGRGYDFASLTPVLAVMAASLGVSVVHLSANPADAGGSYGSAASMDLPGRLTTQSRQAVWQELYVRLLKWMGAPDPHVWFESLLDGAEKLRVGQLAQLLWNSGLFKSKAAKAKFVEAWGEAGFEVGDIPDGVLLPNNKESVARNDIDTDGTGQTSSGNGQGQSTGTGDIPSGNDLRDNTLT